MDRNCRDDQFDRTFQSARDDAGIEYRHHPGCGIEQSGRYRYRDVGQQYIAAHHSLARDRERDAWNHATVYRHRTDKRYMDGNGRHDHNGRTSSQRHRQCPRRAR